MTQLAEEKAKDRVWYLVKLAQLCLIVNLIEPMLSFARTLPLVFSHPEFFFDEFRYGGLSTLTILGMLFFLRYSKTVIATMCWLFAFAGFHDLMFYEWTDYMMEDLKWAIPFSIAGAALVAAILFEKAKPDGP